MGAPKDIIQYITFSTLSNTSDFGDLSEARYHCTATASNGTRGVVAGGQPPTASGGARDIIEYVTIATTGDAVDFGNLTDTRIGSAGASNGTRMVIAGGSTDALGSTVVDFIEYIAIATTGNATDFGNLTNARHYAPGGVGDGTYGVFGGGYDSSYSNVIDYVTISTTANASDFGDLTTAQKAFTTAAGDGTKGVFFGGQHPAVNIIDYVTIASAGNATDFGDLAAVNYGPAATSGD